MKLLSAFFKLVRWPNLLFIALTQLLFHTCVYQPLTGSTQFGSLLWIIVASVCIAAAGYIINDYFDLNIDQINKTATVVPMPAPPCSPAVPSRYKNRR